MSHKFLDTVVTILALTTGAIGGLAFTDFGVNHAVEVIVVFGVMLIVTLITMYHVGQIKLYDALIECVNKVGVKK